MVAAPCGKKREGANLEQKQTLFEDLRQGKEYRERAKKGKD